MYSVFAFVLLTNCEKEDVVIDNTQQVESNISQKSTLEKLSIQDLQFDKKFRKVVEDFNIENDIFSTNNFRKSGTVSNYVIDTSSVIKVQQEDYTSYTFAIKRDNQEEDVLENLVIEQKNDSVQGFFIKYKFSQKYLDSLADNKVIPFDGSVQRTIYKNDIEELLASLNKQPSNTTQTKNMVCYYTYVTIEVPCKGDLHHKEGEACPYIGTYKQAYSYTAPVRNCIQMGSGNNNYGWSNDGYPQNNTNNGGNPSSNPNTSNTGVNDPYSEDRMLRKRADRLSSRLSLNTDQRGWLRLHDGAYLDKIEEFLGDIEDTNEVKNAIENLVSYNSSNYPGKEDGYPFEWWNDESFIKNSGNFDMPADNPNAPNEGPNFAEAFLYTLFPKEAVLHIKNAAIALTGVKLVANDFSDGLLGLEDGKSDAFRHAYWNALDTSEFGPFVTKFFTNAHEFGQNSMRSRMDLFNNSIGIAIAIQNVYMFTTNIFIIADDIKEAVLDGKMKYINNGNLIFTNQ